MAAALMSVSVGQEPEDSWGHGAAVKVSATPAGQVPRDIQFCGSVSQDPATFKGRTGEPHLLKRGSQRNCRRL